MFFNLFKKKFIDESLEDQEQDLKKEIPGLYPLAIKGRDCDSLIDSEQDFGRIAANSIPVNGAIGEMKYINRLRCKCGTGLMYHRLGSTKSGKVNGPIDIYETVCENGKHWDILYLHPYHPRRSSWLPVGYEFSAFHPIFSKFPIGYGINNYDKNFPFGLGEYIKIHFGEPMARNYEIVVLNRSKFVRPRDHIKKLGPTENR